MITMTILWKTYLRDKWDAFKTGESIWTWVLIGMGTAVVFPMMGMERFNPFNLIFGSFYGVMVKIVADMFKYNVDRFREKYVQ